MADLNSRLMDKKSTQNMTYDQLQQRLNQQIQQFTTKNATLAKKADVENDPAFIRNFNTFKNQMNDDIAEMQSNLAILTQKAKASPQKNQVKKLKDTLTQQIDRFKVNMRKIINSSFTGQIEARRASSMHSSMDSSDQYMRNNNNNDGADSSAGSNHSRQQQNQINKQTREQNQQWENDLELERQIIEERDEAFNRFEQEINQINENFNEMGRQIVEQGEDLNIIEENVVDTQQNAIQTDKKMQQAQEIQKSTTNKYWIFAIIILLALAVTLIIVFTT